MKRKRYADLLKWKKNSKRKPLILQGARQVGKTYLVTQFGKSEYENFVYLNFEQSQDLSTLFEGNINPDIIIENISLYFGIKITSDNTLLFFDEIQTVPNVLTSLKYFCEQAPEYHIIAAGSLLGVSVGKSTSFPVGKVNFMDLLPMSFTEFLEASEETIMADKIQNIQAIKPLPEAIHEKLLKYYKLYLFVGGMPEVVKIYLENKDVAEVRKIQNELLEAYKRDFSKYADKNQAVKTAEVWHSIPHQLAKENKKFKYADIKKNSRASQYQQTIEWLRGAGLINPAFNISTPKLPLGSYVDESKFKIYLLDTGLLGAMLNLSSKMITQPEDIFKAFNGAFVENYVAQELTAMGMSPLYYWTSSRTAEVDFIIEHSNQIYPLEVKSGTNLSMKSLQSYTEKYQPKKTFRASPRNFIQSGSFMNLPLYALPAFYGSTEVAE